MSVVLPPNLLRDVPLERLRKISDNEDSFYEYFSELQLDEITKIHNDRDRIVKANREISLESLDLKPTFEGKKAHLVESNLRATELKENYDTLYKKLNTLTKSFDQKQLLKDLRDLAKESEKEADDLTEKFLDRSNGVDLDSFVKGFLDSRVLYWKRKVKADKMDELLKQGPLNVAPSSSTYPHSASEPSLPVYATPYPTNNPPMQSLPPPARQAPYPSTSPGQQRRSLPTSSISYQQQNAPPYASLAHSQPQYSMPPAPYPTSQGRVPPPRPGGYPGPAQQQRGGYAGPQPMGGYPPSQPQPYASYRPPPVGGQYGGYPYPHGQKY